MINCIIINYKVLTETKNILKFYSVWEGRFRSTENYATKARRCVFRETADLKGCGRKTCKFNKKMNAPCRELCEMAMYGVWASEKEC